ncbi:hypothetical protein SAMN06269185_0581 [Natronoarchaeum philippinense]|uniref:Rhomboid family protein n=1 Tax=Natronoarchaeum philippinense TaxID=558529 RepID=A0A285N962_NATPI|nr:hypothetical protein [Natronoarchaeum philippinense]SNZ04496.1 hypothetical protein SAMN06269185_0581 [Natronoarchaeum philippinense]
MATETETTGVRQYGRDAVTRDLLVLLAVPACLVAIHALGSASLRADLALDHADPELAEFLTAAYVHATPRHLWNNVLGFLAGAPMAYMLCLRAGRRRWFHATLGSILVVVPVAVNAANYATLGLWYAGPPPTTSGFSAVVAATGGFVFVALVAWLADLYSRSTATFVGALVLLALVTTFYSVHVDALDPMLVGLLGVSAVLCLLALAVGSDLSIRADADLARHVAVRAVPVALVALLLVTFVVGLFPRETVREGMFVNVYAHGAGFVLGAAIAAGLAPLVED